MVLVVLLVLLVVLVLVLWQKLRVLLLILVLVVVLVCIWVVVLVRLEGTSGISLLSASSSPHPIHMGIRARIRGNPAPGIRCIRTPLRARVGVLLFLEVIRQWPELGSWKVLGVKHQMELGVLALVEVTLLLDVLEVTQVGPTHQPPWRMRKSTCCRFPVVLGGLGISPAIP